MVFWEFLWGPFKVYYNFTIKDEGKEGVLKDKGWGKIRAAFQ